MKLRVRLATIAGFMFFSTSSSGLKLDQSIQLQYSQSSVCRSVSATFFAVSKHEKGDRGGRLNERNFGYAGSCFHNSGRTFYTLVGALENSQFEDTFVLGPGVRLRSPQFVRMSIEGGIEIPFIYYELRYRSGYVYGFLPIVYLGFNLELPRLGGFNFGNIGIGQRTFGQSKEKIRLYSVEWRKEF